MSKLNTISVSFNVIKQLWVHYVTADNEQGYTFFEFCENELGLKYIESIRTEEYGKQETFAYLDIINNKKWCFAVLAYNIQYTTSYEK